MIEARERGDVQRIVALAHQIETMARQKKLDSLDHYLRPLRKRDGHVKGDGAEAVADLLDRKIAKQDRADRAAVEADHI